MYRSKKILLLIVAFILFVMLFYNIIFFTTFDQECFPPYVIKPVPFFQDSSIYFRIFFYNIMVIMLYLLYLIRYIYICFTWRVIKLLDVLMRRFHIMDVLMRCWEEKCWFLQIKYLDFWLHILSQYAREYAHIWDFSHLIRIIDWKTTFEV